MMTRLVHSVVAGLFVGMLCTARAAAPPDLPTEFTYVLECRSTNAAAWKGGFPERTNCCPPVIQYFRQLEFRSQVEVEYTFPWAGSYADHTICRLVSDGSFEQRGMNGSWTSVLCEGGFGYAWGDCYSASGSSTCDGTTLVEYWEGTPTETNYFAGGPSYGSPYVALVEPHDPYAFWFFMYSDDALWWWEADCAGYYLNAAGDIWINGYNLGWGTNFTREILSDEFTTAQLVAMLTNSLTGDLQPCGNKSDSASVSFSEDETYASGTAVEARFKVFAPAGEPWEIPYLRWRVGYSNSVAVWTNRTEESVGGIGAGQWTYSNVVIARPYWTYTNGSCVYYAKAEEWIEVGCANSTPCTSRGCPLTPGGPVVILNDAGAMVQLGLGPSAFGEGFGMLAWAASGPNANLTAPAALELVGDLNGSEILRTNGVLRQVKGLLALADIQTNSATSFSIRFYTNYTGPDNGYYTGSGDPFSAVTIAQGASTNQVLVTINNGSVTEYVYDWSLSDQGWTLTSGAGLRKESITWNPTTLVRTGTTTNSVNQTVYQEAKHYFDLTNYGRLLSQRVIGPSGPALTTQWFYYDNPATDGTNYGKIKLVVEATGSWRRYQYDHLARLTNEVSQFLNAPTNAPESQCRAVTYDYTSLDGVNAFETRVETLLGQEVAREYSVQLPGESRHIRCVSPGAAWNNADNLVTVTRYYGSGDWAGKVQSVIHPDGTMQLYEYQDWYGSRHTTVYSGQPNGDGSAVTNGTATTTVVNQYGQTTQRFVWDIALGISALLDYEQYSHDSVGRVTTTYYLDYSTTTVNYDCCGIMSTVDRDGVTTIYLYDGLKRQIGTLRNDVTTTNLLDAADRVLVTVRAGSDGTCITNRRALYDVAGQLTRETNALSGITTYTNYLDASGQTVRVTTYPDGGQRTETSYQDGSLRSVAGSAAFPVCYTNGAYSGGTWAMEIKGSATGTEWVKSYADMLGRTWKTEYPGGAASTNFYNSKGQLEKTVDPDGVATLYSYNALGEVEKTILDMNRNGVGTDSVDRVTRQTNDVFWGSNALYRRSRLYQTADNGDELLASERLTAGNPVTSISVSFGLGTTNVTSYDPYNQQRTVTTTHPDGSQTVTLYTNGLLASVTRYADAWQSTVLTQTDYAYDAHGRLQQTIDARNGATTYGYNHADLVTTNTTPAPAPGEAALVTTTFYDESLRGTNVLHPDNTSTKTVYWTNGLPRKTWGSRVYPVEYAYDHAGRMTNMTTWQNFNETTGQGTSGGAATAWVYDSARGWLSQKKYADNTGPSYAYTAAGRLASRGWARGITTWYTNNNAGELERVWHSDGTPGATNTYDRRGRITQVATLNTQLTRTLNDAGQVLVESYSGGPLNGLSVTNGYDEFLRRTNLSLLNSQSSILASTAYAYDSASRLDTVSDGTNSAAYGYLTGSPLVENITFATNGTTVMTTSKGYDALNRLTNISTLNAELSTLNSFRYAYNSASQRTSVTNADGSRWVYTYDSLGQVTSGKKYWADGTPVAGQQFTYGFDDIGNRQTTAAGGDAAGGNLRTATCGANLLNQYTNRTVPGYVNMLGEATNTATVTVWTQDGWFPTTRQGDYFRSEVAANNASAPVWLNITNFAVLKDGTNPDIVTNVTGKVLLAKSPEAFTYDADGNLTSDSLWTNVWNGENRRTVVESGTGVPPVARMREQWTHLPDGRWIERIVSTWDAQTLNYQPSTTNRFVCDGQVLLAVLDHTNGLVMSFTRGLDLSGTVDGAGGVGGVLWVMVGPAVPSGPLANTTHFAAYDGNGNVTALVNAADGSESARYQYGPFAEPIRITGPAAKLNPIRFSTQYADDVTGDLKYLFRDYRADAGRWLCKDPREEDAGLSLYAFVCNDSLNGLDLLGLVNVRFEVLYGTVGGKWGQPGEFADGGYYITTDRAHSWNTLWNPPVGRGYGGSCNTVWRGFNLKREATHAGTIRIYVSDLCPGTYTVKFWYQCRLRVKAPERKADALGQVFSAGGMAGRSELWTGRATPGNDAIAPRTYAQVSITVKSKRQEVLVGEYVPTLSWPNSSVHHQSWSQATLGLKRDDIVAVK